MICGAGARVMSLTSRILNIFSTSETSHLAPSDGHNQISIDRSEALEALDHAEVSAKKSSLSSKNAVEEEEEGRPPYLHVRRSCYISENDFLACQ